MSLGLAVGTAGWAAGARRSVWVVVSEPGGVYGEAFSAFEQETARDTRFEVKRFLISDRLPVNEPPAVVVTLGTAAFSSVAFQVRNEPSLRSVPVLAALLPRSGYEKVVSSGGELRSFGFWIDQPLERFMVLLRLALPRARRVGVVLGSASASLKPALQQAAEAQGLSLSLSVLSEQAGADEVYPVLSTVLSDADVMLAVPDNQIFNAATLQNILIAAYRQRVPVVSYALAHVRAGATLALYTTAAQVAAQVAAGVNRLMAGQKMPAVQSAADLTVAVNGPVSRSLGLVLPDEAALGDAIRRREAGR